MADKLFTCCRGAEQHDGFEQPPHAARHDSNRQPNAHGATYGHAQEHAPNEHVRHYVNTLCHSFKRRPLVHTVHCTAGSPSIPH